MEIWKPIEFFESYYEVSTFGKVRSLDRLVKHKHLSLLKGSLLKQTKHSKGAGYLSVSLMKDGKAMRRNVHRLVAFAFIPNPDNKPFVAHKDDNPENNHVDNLEWNYPKENSMHSARQGRMKRKLSFNEVREIRRSTEHKKIICTKYGVTAQAIHAIRKNKVYTHLL